MNFLSSLFRSPVADQEVRAEIWRLGSRYRGAPLDGALEELKDPTLTDSRAVLLRACVHKLRTQKA